MNYYISFRPCQEYTAWYKAIADVEHFLSSMGFKPLPVQSCKANLESNLLPIPAPKDSGEVDLLLLQYPKVLFEGLDLYWFTDFIRANCKNIRLVALVHDLDSIRFGNFNETDELTEVPILNRFDYLITVNDAMTKVLVEHGATAKIFSMTLFDYVLPEEAVPKANALQSKSIAYAGNLKFDKSRFVYDLNQIDLRDVSINLYGPMLDFGKFSPSPNVRFVGAFPAEELPSRMREGYGLCWDGDRIERCGGRHCEYFRYSNPHKVSLYLAMGMPVIVSKDISTAAILEKEGAGIGIDSLCELPYIVESISEEKYESLRANALRLSQELRNGQHLKSAVHQIINDIRNRS